MSLSRKFVFMLVSCVLTIAIVNIAAFYVFYSSYISLYFSEKISARESITIEFINNIIERQTLEDIDSIFDDVEIEFFELLDNNQWEIPLEKTENINIVVEYLAKSWVSSKFIEEVIPENNLEKILTLLQDPNSPESNFIKRLFISLVLTNIVTILFLAFIVFYFTRKIILPIKRATTQIAALRPGESKNIIKYEKKDEIGLLIKSINGLNTRLSIQEKIRSRLLADISHELKTPITSIQCYLEWISDWVIELSDTNLESITSEMSRLTQLVNQIMEFEKFENSKIVLEKKAYNPYEIIYNIIETQKAQLQLSEQTVSIEWSQNIEVFFDKDLFTQLVYNLISNFRKYAWDARHLNISISSKQIVFSDNGVWISEKEIPFLFEKFYQGKKEKSWNIEIRWIWVWLSIVQKIIQAHAWDSKVQSGVNKWFSFSIIF